jgi:hypothetical protein
MALIERIVDTSQFEKSISGVLALVSNPDSTFYFRGNRPAFDFKAQFFNKSTDILNFSYFSAP